jgi:hypothetical protein
MPVFPPGDPAPAPSVPPTEGTYASAEAVPEVGAAHYCSEGPIIRRCVVAGTWMDYYPPYGKVTLPLAGEFATMDDAVAAVGLGGGGMTLSLPALGVYRLRKWHRVHAAPARYRAIFASYFVGDAGFGMFFRRSANANVWAFFVGREHMIAYNWTGADGPGGPLVQVTVYRDCHALEIEDDGATMNAYAVLPSGETVLVTSQAYGVHLGGAPDQVGICGWNLGTLGARSAIYEWRTV